MPKKILFACHDAGGANVITALLKTVPRENFTPLTIAAGPAVDIFKREGIPIGRTVSEPLSETAAAGIWDEFKPEAAVLGTSSNSMLERLLVNEGKKRSAFTISFVDWWSAYAERFSTPREKDLNFLPDCIAVSDNFAREGCIAAGLPSALISVTGNPYWDLLQDKAEEVREKRLTIRASLRVPDRDLLIAVIFGAARHMDLGLGCDEEDLMRIISPLPEKTVSGRKVHYLALKHPSENWDSFNKLIAPEATRLRTSPELSSLDGVFAADGAVGLISTLQFEAALLGKNVLCLLPGGIPKRLPLAEVFPKVGVKTVLNEKECRTALVEFLEDAAKPFDKSKLPASITHKRSSHLIVELLSKC